MMWAAIPWQKHAKLLSWTVSQWVWLTCNLLMLTMPCIHAALFMVFVPATSKDYLRFIKRPCTLSSNYTYSYSAHLQPQNGQNIENKYYIIIMFKLFGIYSVVLSLVSCAFQHTFSPCKIVSTSLEYICVYKYLVSPPTRKLLVWQGG